MGSGMWRGGGGVGNRRMKTAEGGLGEGSNREEGVSVGQGGMRLNLRKCWKVTVGVVEGRGAVAPSGTGESAPQPLLRFLSRPWRTGWGTGMRVGGGRGVGLKRRAGGVFGEWGRV